MGEILLHADREKHAPDASEMNKSAANLRAGLRYGGKLQAERDDLRDSEYRRTQWLDNAKREAGYGTSISFDLVWEAALAALLEQRQRSAASIADAKKPVESLKS